MPADRRSETTDTNVRVMPLTGDQVLQAYSLVREVAPEMSLQAWRNYVAGLGRNNGGPTEDGVLAATSHGYILGLCTYRCHFDLEEGWMLTVDNVIPCGIPGPRTLTAALFEAAEDLARARGCGGIRLTCPVTLDWLFGVARRRDYRRCRWHFCKRIPA